MSIRTLITGIAGFTGSHVAERMLAGGHAVHGVVRSVGPYPNLEPILGSLTLHIADMRHQDAFARVIASVRPDVIVHLAGVAHNRIGRDSDRARLSNTAITKTLLGALEMGPGTRLIFASSAAVYGQPLTLPANEDCELKPLNPYGVGKVVVETLVREFGNRTANPTTILRPGNQIGPRQPEDLVPSSFAEQIARAESGLTAPIVRHGALHTKRDFVDVRDVAQAYVSVATLSDPGTHVFNVGSGVATPIAYVLQALINAARIGIDSSGDSDADGAGLSQTQEICLDSTSLRERLNWRPTIGLPQSLADTLEYWRQKYHPARRRAH